MKKMRFASFLQLFEKWFYPFDTNGKRWSKQYYCIG